MKRRLESKHRYLHVLMVVVALFAILIIALAHDEWPATPGGGGGGTTTTQTPQDGDTQGP